MATQLLFMASNDPTRQEEPTRHLIGLEETKPETAKQRGKRSSKSKSPSQKKQPQRGMGVAQLERLRLQEGWKKIADTNNPLPSLNIQNQFQYQLPYSFSDAVPFGVENYGSTINGTTGDLPGWNRVLMLQRIGNGGFAAGGYGVGGLVSDQATVDPRFRIGNVFENSKELSSMPKMQSLFDQCDVCYKSKPINNEHFSFNYGGQEKITETPSINGCDGLELNLGNNHNINGEIKSSGPRVARRAGGNPNEEVEVMAIHRKKNSVRGGVLMEYEFFPGNGGRSTSIKESKMCAVEASTTVAGEAVFATTASDTNAPNSIDLSLKLSF